MTVAPAARLRPELVLVLVLTTPALVLAIVQRQTFDAVLTFALAAWVFSLVSLVRSLGSPSRR